MRKISLMWFITLIIVIPTNLEARDICGDYGDKCMADCEKYYTGNTFWDGAGRTMCRMDCETTEALCRYGELLDEIF